MLLRHMVITACLLGVFSVGGTAIVAWTQVNTQHRIGLLVAPLSVHAAVRVSQPSDCGRNLSRAAGRDRVDDARRQRAVVVRYRCHGGARRS